MFESSQISVSTSVLNSLAFDANGLVPAIAQDAVTNEILMVAWMDRAAFLRTLETGKACYYSRSRKSAWMKGESSGHLQILREVRVDCDGGRAIGRHCVPHRTTQLLFPHIGERRMGDGIRADQVGSGDVR